MKFNHLEDKLSGMIDEPEEETTASLELEVPTPYKKPNLPVTMQPPIQGQDKVEMAMFSAVSLILVAVVFVAAYVTTKKLLNPNPSPTPTVQTSPQTIPGLVLYQNQVVGFSFFYPETWQLLEPQPNVLKLSLPTAPANETVYILLANVNAFLESRQITIVGQTVHDFCELTWKTCSAPELKQITDHTTPSGVKGKQGIFQAGSSNTDINNLSAYFFEVDDKNTDTLIIISSEQHATKTIDTVLKTLTITHDN